MTAVGVLIRRPEHHDVEIGPSYSSFKQARRPDEYGESQGS